MAVAQDVRGVRASDEERERVASEVREHFALGRIDAEELDRRLGLAYSARDLGELRALRADLPVLHASPARGRKLAARARVAVLPFLACSLVWLATGAQGSFWPMWVGLAGIVGLARGRRLIRMR